VVEKLIIKRQAAPLRQEVLQTLRTEIIEGRLPPGQRLTERALTEMLGVSRTVLRESLRQLEAEGLISLIPNKGPMVRALTIDEARELYRIREMLEGLGARLFAENAAPANLAALDSALSEVEQSYATDNPKNILIAKNAFYAAIHDGSRCAALSKMTATVLAQVWRWRAVGLAHPQRSKSRAGESIANLRDVVQAIRSGDGEMAETVARKEARLAATEVLRVLESLE
jgi:DNA-binding GntR family transcriptional regulator